MVIVEDLLDHLAVAYLPHSKYAGAWALIDYIVATATAQGIEQGRAEGAEQERERIERAGEVFNGTNFDSTQRWFMIPASVFAPKGEKP